MQPDTGNQVSENPENLSIGEKVDKLFSILGTDAPKEIEIAGIMRMSAMAKTKKEKKYLFGLLGLDENGIPVDKSKSILNLKPSIIHSLNKSLKKINSNEEKILKNNFFRKKISKIIENSKDKNNPKKCYAHGDYLGMECPECLGGEIIFKEIDLKENLKNPIHKKCPNCGGNHSITDCPEYLKSSK